MKPKSNRKHKLGPMDNCQTPPYAIEPLMDWLSVSDVIWECAAGDGILARALRSKGFRVMSSDIDPAGKYMGCVIDFLEQDLHVPYDVIVTNPPFSLKYEWIERCYELDKPFALLLPVETQGAYAAQRLFNKHGITTLYMSPRVDFKMPKAGWLGSGAQMPTAWFLGGLGERGRHYYYRLDKLNKHDLNDMDKAGKL